MSEKSAKVTQVANGGRSQCVLGGLDSHGAVDSSRLQRTLGEPLTLRVKTRCGAMAFCRRGLPQPSTVFDTFWRFAAERQEVFYRKLSGAQPPWTCDPILQTYKFTNAYRASDRVSQYLIRHVLYEGEQTPREIFFRTMLFKLFNKIETWKLLTTILGWPQAAEYSVERYERVLSKAQEKGVRIYSSAYIMPSALGFGSRRKHINHLRLLEKMLSDNVPERIADAYDMKTVFLALQAYHSMGAFLAYQLAIDLNYSTLTNFTEMEFVVPGPGAVDGIRKCFTNLGGYGDIDIIRLVADCQAEEFEKRGLRFWSLWGRSLQLVDCQNLFCEVDKYARVAHPEVRSLTGRRRIKQRYVARLEPMSAWYPPKWKLNEAIASSRSAQMGDPGRQGGVQQAGVEVRAENCRL